MYWPVCNRTSRFSTAGHHVLLPQVGAPAAKMARMKSVPIFARCKTRIFRRQRTSRAGGACGGFRGARGSDDRLGRQGGWKSARDARNFACVRGDVFRSLFGRFWTPDNANTTFHAPKSGRCGVSGGRLDAAMHARSTAVGRACAHVLALPTAARCRSATARPGGGVWTSHRLLHAL